MPAKKHTRNERFSICSSSRLIDVNRKRLDKLKHLFIHSSYSPSLPFFLSLNFIVLMDIDPKDHDRCLPSVIMCTADGKINFYDFLFHFIYLPFNYFDPFIFAIRGVVKINDERSLWNKRCENIDKKYKNPKSSTHSHDMHTSHHIEFLSFMSN